MLKETFNWPVAAGASGNTKFATAVSQFGDGYEQSVSLGIRPKKTDWSVTVEGELDYLKDVTDFIDRHGGSKSFWWTPPFHDKPELFRVAEYSTPSRGGYAFSITFTMKAAQGVAI